MKTWSYLLPLVGLFTSFSSLADDGRQQILNQLKVLQQQGFDKAEKYQLSDMNQFKQCVNESKNYRAMAKELKETIMASKDVIFRIPAYQAADLAFQCVYCSDGAINYCQKMEKYIVQVEKELEK